MIIYTIILIVAGLIIGLLAIIATIAIQESRRQAHYKQKAYREEARAKADIDTLGAENSRLREENTDLSEALESVRVLYNKVLRERQELVARNTALVEAMEARPTQPKRTVRKNTQATE